MLNKNELNKLKNELMKDFSTVNNLNTILESLSNEETLEFAAKLLTDCFISFSNSKELMNDSKFSAIKEFIDKRLNFFVSFLIERILSLKTDPIQRVRTIFNSRTNLSSILLN